MTQYWQYLLTEVVHKFHVSKRAGKQTNIRSDRLFTVFTDRSGPQVSSCPSSTVIQNHFHETKNRKKKTKKKEKKKGQ